jgi:RsiW-degrading membrane proteinase PrsW (M82 family)
VIYLRKLDIFEIEKWKHVVITVVLGMFFSFFVYPLSDFNNLILGFTINGGVINDFLYCVIGIGAIEELVKILPLLLMLKYTKAINEPFDYIKFASLSALGFAFVENLMYFDESSLHIIHGRALTAVVFHMFASSIIGYGLMLNRYKRYRNPWLNFLAFFALASLAHGFYDFWLINEAVRDFSFITFIFLLLCLSVWNYFQQDALSHSEFFDEAKSIDRGKLQDYLLYSLAGVLLFEYVALVLKFGPGLANAGLESSLYSGTYLIVFLSLSLSNVKIIRGKWAPVRPLRKTDHI